MTEIIKVQKWQYQESELQWLVMGPRMLALAMDDKGEQYIDIEHTMYIVTQLKFIHYDIWFSDCVGSPTAAVHAA